MQDLAVSHDFFPHIRVLISLIVGLGVTRLLSGVARIIQHPGRTPVYWVHLGWALWMFVGLLNFWWWEFRLEQLHTWKFDYYVFVNLFATLHFLLCAMLFPDQMQDYRDYRDYFLSRRAWFFGLLAALFLLDVADTLLKGGAYAQHFGYEYPLRIALHVALCVAAMRTTNRWFHAALVVFALAYQLRWILLWYEVAS